jgi:hypothetical protein
VISTDSIAAATSSGKSAESINPSSFSYLITSVILLNATLAVLRARAAP